MTLYAKELNRHVTDCFVETGTEEGNGCITALTVGFSDIISIEASECFCRKAQSIFEDYEQVNIVHGDSSKILFDVIRDITGRITFWLDAHSAYQDDINISTNLLPVLEELNQIAKHHRKDNIILIDDIDYLGTRKVTLDVLKESIKRISKDYQFTVVDGHVHEGNVVEHILVSSTEALRPYDELPVIDLLEKRYGDMCVSIKT